MLKRFLVIIASVLAINATALRADSLPVPDPKAEPASTETTTKEILTDAAIAALIIAGSIALYKATGHPCACPSDTMRNGRACGGRSAWSKAGGAKPLCFPTDITSEMISAYRATKAIPPVW
jgi:hypothetical protein